MKQLFAMTFLLFSLLSTSVFAQDLTLVRTEDGEAIFSLEFSDNISLAVNSDADQTAADGTVSAERGKLVCRCKCGEEEMDMSYDGNCDFYNGISCVVGDTKGKLADCTVTAVVD